MGIDADADCPAYDPEFVSDLLDSYSALTGRLLIPRVSASADVQALFGAPIVVVAHGTEDDPLLCFGNAAALRLWEMSSDQFLGTPSRMTAEPMHREERRELLDRTSRFGYIDDYSGIRISASGRRFRIEQATVWNVVSSSGARIGQAAAFSEWHFLDGADSSDIKLSGA